MLALSWTHAALSLFAILTQCIASTCPTVSEVQDDLGGMLSPGSSISNNFTDAPRWSLYGAPTPAFIVNVGSENDVATTVGTD